MKKPKAPRLVTVSIFTTVTLIFWIFFSLYNVLTKEPQVNVDPELLDPLDPNLDTETLGKIKDRVFFTEAEVAEIALPSIILPSPAPAVETITQEEPTPEAQITETPVETPTPEGGLNPGG